MKVKAQGQDALIGRYRYFFFIAVIVFLLDRLTKQLVVLFFKDEKVLLPKVLSLNLVVNTGAGFGILQGQTFWLSLVTVIVLGVISYYLKDIVKETYFWSAALIFGGAIGNLFDRVIYGFVIDFIDFHIWPVFNIADIAISIGALGVVYYVLLDIKKKK